MYLIRNQIASGAGAVAGTLLGTGRPRVRKDEVHRGAKQVPQLEEPLVGDDTSGKAPRIEEVWFMSQEGHRCILKMQLTHVCRCLVSVSRIGDVGHMLV